MAESSSFGSKWEKAGVKQQHAESVCGANQHPGLRRNAWSRGARQRHSDESFASPVMCARWIHGPDSRTNRQLDQELDREPFNVSVNDLADCRLRYLEFPSGLRLTPTPVFDVLLQCGGSWLRMCKAMASSRGKPRSRNGLRLMTSVSPERVPDIVALLHAHTPREPWATFRESPRQRTSLSPYCRTGI